MMIVTELYDFKRLMGRWVEKINNVNLSDREMTNSDSHNKRWDNPIYIYCIVYTHKRIVISTFWTVVGECRDVDWRGRAWVVFWQILLLDRFWRVLIWYDFCVIPSSDMYRLIRDIKVLIFFLILVMR